MTGDAIAGDFKGTSLVELPLGVKTQWKDWVLAHPDTTVLSVRGQEHVDNNPYDNYFDSADGFRGTEARDGRLPTKASIYAFQLGGHPYATPFDAFEGGAPFGVGGDQVFLFRPAGVAIYYSTLAWRSLGQGFEQRDGVWHDVASGARFDPERAQFVGGTDLPRLEGFDTFWYTWSLTHPDTELLGNGA